MYKQDYGTLGSSDWFSGTASGAAERWCDTDQLYEIHEGSQRMIDDLQSYVGGSRAKFRVQFNQMLTNGNGISDMVRLGMGIELIINYYGQ